MCVLVTIATLSLIFLGTSGSGASTLVFQYDILRRRIRDVVGDAARRDRALATLDTMEETARSHIQDVLDALDEAREQMQEYGTDLDAIERDKVAALDPDRMAFLMQMLDHRFELKDALLEEEWNRVFAAAA